MVFGSKHQSHQKVFRIYSDRLGESHIEEKLIPLDQQCPIGLMSNAYSASSIMFRYADDSWNLNERHTAPRKQFVIMVNGESVIETTDGNSCHIHTGDVLLLEDTTGKGHTTTGVEGKPRWSIVVPIVE